MPKSELPEPTHIVSFWGVKCFYSTVENTLWGTNFLYEALIPVATAFHKVMSAVTFFITGEYPDYFQFKVIHEFERRSDEQEK